MINNNQTMANANESKDAVVPAGVKQSNTANTMGTFNFNITQETFIKKYDNEGAYKTLQTMMKNKEQLIVKFYSSKESIPCAWIESKRVAPFKYELKSETFQGLMTYLNNGEVSDFDSNPTQIDTLNNGDDFQLLVMQITGMVN